MTKRQPIRVGRWWRSVVAATGLVLGARDVQASDFRLVWHWSFAGREKAILDVILGVEQRCDKGCRYRGPRVVRSVILPRERSSESFYLWTASEDIRNSQWFSHLTTRHDTHGIHVEIRLVPDTLARTLAAESGRPSDPAFDGFVMTYDIEEVFVNGQFSKTQVTFTDWISLGALASFFGSGTVRNRMTEGAHAMYVDFAAIRP